MKYSFSSLENIWKGLESKKWKFMRIPNNCPPPLVKTRKFFWRRGGGNYKDNSGIRTYYWRKMKIFYFFLWVCYFFLIFMRDKILWPLASPSSRNFCYPPPTIAFFRTSIQTFCFTYSRNVKYFLPLDEQCCSASFFVFKISKKWC